MRRFVDRRKFHRKLHHKIGSEEAGKNYIMEYL
jgi:hypothetical protein